MPKIGRWVVMVRHLLSIHFLSHTRRNLLFNSVCSRLEGNFFKKRDKIHQAEVAKVITQFVIGILMELLAVDGPTPSGKCYWMLWNLTPVASFTDVFPQAEHIEDLWFIELFCRVSNFIPKSMLLSRAMERSSCYPYMMWSTMPFTNAHWVR